MDNCFFVVIAGQRRAPVSKFLPRIGRNTSIDNTGQECRAAIVLRVVGGQFNNQVDAEEHLQVSILLCRAVAGRIYDYFVIASWQARKTKTPAVVGEDLVDYSSGESFQANRNFL